MIKPVYVCALLFVLILAAETISVEGRVLAENNKVCEGNCLLPNDTSSVNGRRRMAAAVHVDDAPIVGAEDARPTAPGHSPGVGHSLGNKGVDKNV